MNTWQPLPLLLASGSPRRKELLDQAGFTFRVAVTHADEALPAGISVYESAEYLARHKANAASDWISGHEILLTADSVVIHEGRILDKPTSVEEAIQHLSDLAGRQHEVMTGICLVHGHQSWSGSALTEVTLSPMSSQEIEWYVAHAKPFDKAGGYGIQEWIGLCKVTRLVGSYANVMGLPVHLVYQALQEFPHWSHTDQR